jgi:hypothetical protein
MSKFIKEMSGKIFTKSEIDKNVEFIHEPIEETLTRFINKGVHQTKIITTISPSLVLWSKSRKCLVGGKGQPSSLEVINDGNGNLRASYENNEFISLQNSGIFSTRVEPSVLFVTISESRSSDTYPRPLSIFLVISLFSKRISIISPSITKLPSGFLAAVD